MTNIQIANTILSQLGGNRFIVMTGAKNLMATENGLRFRIGKNAGKVTHVEITLNGWDLYDMTFTKFTPGRLNKKTYEWIDEKVQTIADFENLYNDQLEDIFTQVTGLYTRI